MARQLIVSILGDADKFRRSLNDATKSADSFGKKVQRAAGIAGAAIGGVLVANLGAGIKELHQAEAAEARFSDALSRSSKQLRQNSDGFKKFAVSIQKSTRFQYEDALAVGTVIAKNEALTRIVDRGALSQEALAKIALDLATIQGVTGAQAAESLAKALAKPEAASKLLLKAGVALTIADKAQIKALVKNGQVAEAQAIILDKLRAKTEGAATAAGETLAGKLERAKNAMGEMQQSIALALLPAMIAMTNAALKISQWAEAHPKLFNIIAIAAGALAATLITVSVATKIVAATQAIASGAAATWTAIQWALNVALTANPIGLVIVAIGALVAAIALIATKTQFFQKVWSSVWGSMASIAKGALNGVINLLRNFGIPAFKIPIPFAPDISFGGAHPFSNIPMLAKGGVATGGKMHIVGENGPELFTPGRTGRVFPNGGGGAPVRVVFDVTGADKELVAFVKKIVRLEGGGNVQGAFGR